MADLKKRQWLQKLKTAFVAARPWSFTASLMGASLGFCLAWKETGAIDYVQAFLTTIAILSIHSAGNLVNTYYDFVNGFDTETSDDKTLVKRTLFSNDIVTCVAGCYCVGVLAFLGVCLRTDANCIVMVVLFGCGLLGSFIYTGAIGLKYIALGDVLIFLTFGLLTTVFAYLGETGEVNMKVVAFALPLAFNTEAVLHGNNTRDIEGDKRAGATTVAILLGRNYACALYLVLLIIPYVLLGILALGYSWALLFPLTTLPMACQLSYQCFCGNTQRIPQKTAEVNTIFGLLYLYGLYIAP